MAPMTPKREGLFKQRDFVYETWLINFYSNIPIAKPTGCTGVIKFILFWNDTLHVSDGLSVRHQEFKTLHTATGTAACLLAGTC